jgi:hypothetical protein
MGFFVSLFFMFLSYYYVFLSFNQIPALKFGTSDYPKWSGPSLLRIPITSDNTDVTYKTLLTFRGYSYSLGSYVVKLLEEILIRYVFFVYRLYREFRSAKPLLWFM